MLSSIIGGILSSGKATFWALVVACVAYTVISFVTI